MLTPNAVKKVVVFEMIFRPNGLLFDFFVFKFFFCFSATGDKYMFSAKRGGHVLVPYGKTPKNWQETGGYVLTKIESAAGTTGKTTYLTSLPNRFPIIKLPLIL